jgi:hypothetical protein
MVKSRQQSEAQGFAERLRQALIDARESPSPTALANEFNLRYRGKSITAHAARNWLLGISLPKQDKLRVLADWLRVSPEGLLLGASLDATHQKIFDNVTVGDLKMADKQMFKSYLTLSSESRRIVQTTVAAFCALESQNTRL